MKLQDLKVVFFGTSDFAVPILNALIDNTQVIALVTQPDRRIGRKQELHYPPTKQLAKFKNINKILQFSDLKSQEVFEDLVSLEADIFIVASYGIIMPKAILEIPPFKSLNVHASILPKYRGASPIHAALLNGDVVTGNTIMLMDEKMDHGPILTQSKVMIADFDDYASLQQKLADDGAKLLIKTLYQYINGEITPREQDHAQATYTSLIKKEDGLIDWNEIAQDIYNKWRAYKYWPGIFTLVGQTQTPLRLDQIQIADKKDLDPGESKVEGGRIFIGCGSQTSIEVLKLTPAGKKPMDAKAYINGYLK